MDAATTTPAVATSAAGTYLTFAVGDDEYGVEILRVREIIGAQAVTPVPDASPHSLGVINLRGSIIPVVSLRRRFALPDAEAHPHHVFIVIETGEGHIGVAVDRVRDVTAFTASEVEPPPPSLGDADGIVRAIGKSQGRIRLLLDIVRVLR